MVMKTNLFFTLFIALYISNIHAKVDSTFHCYLLFGQSNMAGGGSGIPFGTDGPSDTVIPADCDTSSRIQVLSFCDCSAKYSADCPKFTQSRKVDTWYTAYPPLHICAEGISPGDWFAKTMVDSIRSDIKIGLIPCALSGQSLNVFFPGGKNFNIPTWAQPTLVNNSPYAWMLARCKLAQQTGVIKGFLLHQGESGTGSPPNLSWVAMASAIMDSLKKNLGLPNTTPVVVGELRADNYAGFNKGNVDSLAKAYSNCGVASSTGLAVQSDDGFHFAAAGMRELGKRFANAFLKLASTSYVPRKGQVNVINQRAATYKDLATATGDISVYTLNGKVIRSYSASNTGVTLRNLNARGLYIVSRKIGDGRTIILPYINN